MCRVLLTAFDPYDVWTTNSSWLSMVEFTKELPADVRIVTRRYPVDFDEVRRRLEKDLAGDFDYAIHLGQAPGSACIKLEAIGLNVRGSLNMPAERYGLLAEDGPIAYRSQAPLGDWLEQLRAAGIPALVSYHAGEYLCNATLYWSHYFAQRRGGRTIVSFLHLPLDPSQTAAQRPDLASLPSAVTSRALQLIMSHLPRLPALQAET